MNFRNTGVNPPYPFKQLSAEQRALHGIVASYVLNVLHQPRDLEAFSSFLDFKW